MKELSKYCREKGVNYNTVLYRLKVKKMSLKDALYQGSYKNCYFLKDGRLVHKVLNKHQYYMFSKRVEKGMLTDEAYQDVLKCSGKPKQWNKVKHWIDGIPLSEYCRRNNLQYQSILNKIKTKPLEEIINEIQNI